MRSARRSTFPFVRQKIRKPSPFLRSRPFFQSSGPISNDPRPALSDTPTTLPSSFHVSSTPSPRMSRYQARLRSRSFTVKLGDAALKASASDRVALLDAAVTFGFEVAFFFARVVFDDFFETMPFLQALAAMTTRSRSQRSHP